MLIKRCSILIAILTGLLIFLPGNLYNQEKEKSADSLKKTKKFLEETEVKSQKFEVELTIQNVDISEFPIIKVIVEAYNKEGKPLNELKPKDVRILENGKLRDILSVEKISVNVSKIPVDFIFIIDQTDSMQKHIDGVLKNIQRFTESLRKRGIDYRLGLILFSDEIEKIYSPTSDVDQFEKWLSEVKAGGGKDEKENALEALLVASKIKFRPLANRVCVIITDAPYHQKGENGVGKTDQTTTSIIDTLKKYDMRLFSIVPANLSEYKTISNATRGKYYSIGQGFSSILNKFSNQLTNLFAIRYDSQEKSIPDSIEISLLDPQKHMLVRKRVPILEVGRPFIIENLLYKTGSWELADTVKELDLIAEAMHKYPKIKIRIEGHTDSRGSARSNQVLSIRRAQSVKNYLIKHGINEDRMTIIGYGESRPIMSNDTEEGRRLNRRTEVIIIDK